MVTCQYVMSILEELAPKKLAEEWDNPGLLVGSPQQEVKKVLVCLDVTPRVVRKAVTLHADMIVAHHPLIFKPVKKVRTDLPLGNMLETLLTNKIAVYAAHTNLDIAKGGVNDVLAHSLGLQHVASFVLMDSEPGASLGRMGALPEPMEIDDFAKMVCASLPAEYVRVVKAGSQKVRKVAICSGSGSEFIDKASFWGADVYVTGDVRYHEALHAAEIGIHLIDAGHFPTEYPIVAPLAGYLQEVCKRDDKDLVILADSDAKDIFTPVMKQS